MNVEEHPARSRDENTLSRAMWDSAEPLHPPVGRLVAGGLARGRRMRVVRRLQVAGAATAAVAAVAAGSTLLPGGGSGREQPSAVLPAAPTPARPSVPAAKLPTQPGPDAKDGSALATLMPSLLPAGVHGQWQAAPGEVAASAVLADAGGSGRSYVAVRRGLQPPELDQTCPDLRGTKATCAVTRLADGSTLRLDQNWEYPATKSTEDGKAGPEGRGARVWSASLARPDRTELYLDSTNSPTEKGTPGTDRNPVLDLTQLRQIVLALSAKVPARP